MAVLDNTDQVLNTVKGDDGRHQPPVPIDQPAVMPTRSTGGSMPITVVNDRKVVVVTGPTVVDFHGPGHRPALACGLLRRPRLLRRRGGRHRLRVRRQGQAA